MVLFDKDALPMFDKVLLAPLMVLFVNVSEVALPTIVSVDVGSVKVPVLLILLMMGEVNVLLVRTCDPVRVTKVSLPAGSVSVAVPEMAMVKSPVPESPRLLPEAPRFVMV
jgi:hypothetical protein